MVGDKPGGASEKSGRRGYVIAGTRPVGNRRLSRCFFSLQLWEGLESSLVEQAAEFLRTPSPRRWLRIKPRADDSEAHASRASTTFDSRVMLVRRWSRPWNL